MENDQLEFRKAMAGDARAIWATLQQAIERRRLDGSSQWQDGYPNFETVINDIEKEQNYVLKQNEKLVATAAVIFNYEPAYDALEGNWLTQGDFLVVHRLAVGDAFLGRGFAIKLFLILEQFAKENNVFSIKVDTNFDNLPMLKILDKLGYVYCGEVYFRGGARRAYEKVLSK